jgi:hypothetical protein
MKAEELNRKFQQGLKFWNEGKPQEGADLWMELAEFGHLMSIEQLVYIFLGQQNYEDAQSYIDCADNPTEPIILYLQARLIEERDGRDAALESFKNAAAAGNRNSISLMFNLALEDNNFTVAKNYLNKLQGQDDFLSNINEPTTFEALHQKLESREYYFNEMAKYRAQDKVFTIAVGSDETNTYLEVRVYDYFDKVLVKNFDDDLTEAIEFCYTKNRGFEVIYVGDSWDITNTEIIYRCNVNWSQNKIKISANYQDYWFGELNDLDSALEELIEKECDWELVNYYLIENEIDASSINPAIYGFNSSLVSFEENTNDDFLNINYEDSKEALWFPIDPNNPNACLKAVIHLSLVLGYGQPGYETNDHLPGDFPNSVTSWQSPEFAIWLDSLTSDSDVDYVFISALKWLSEGAYAEDPGWTFILNGDGLRMSSVWTEDSDIWGDREFREPSPEVDMHVIRELWESGQSVGDCSFECENLTFEEVEELIIKQQNASKVGE